MPAGRNARQYAAKGRRGDARLSTTARQAGTLGGGCVEAEVKRRALGLLGREQSEVCTFQLDSDYGWDDGLICGGRMKIAGRAGRDDRGDAAYFRRLCAI